MRHVSHMLQLKQQISSISLKHCLFCHLDHLQDVMWLEINQFEILKHKNKNNIKFHTIQKINLKSTNFTMVPVVNASMILPAKKGLSYT